MDAMVVSAIASTRSDAKAKGRPLNLSQATNCCMASVQVSDWMIRAQALQAAIRLTCLRRMERGAQSWTISSTNVAPAGYYNLATECGFCLTASSTASGAPVVLDPCNGSTAQAWNAVSAGSTYEFNPANNPSNCLDVRGDATASGTLVQTFSCNSGPNEQWAVN
jgi:Ricin-type beta-trefoil lectin domain-like